MGRAGEPGGRYRSAAGNGSRSASGARFIAVCLVLTALAGCAPNLGTPPEIRPPTAYETSRSLAASTADWPRDAWWKAYGDAQLDRLIGDALENAPDLRIAEARVREANAAVEQSGAALWPAISVNGAALPTQNTLNQGFPPQYKALLPHNWHVQGSATGNLAYEFDFFGKNRAALVAATSAALAADVDAAAARIALSTSVAETYGELLRLTADQAAVQDAVALRKQSAAQVSARVSQSLENVGQLSEANALVASAQADEDAIDGQIARARHAIAALVGKGPDYGLDVVPAPGETLAAFGLPRSLSMDLVGRRPDIVAARLRAEAAASRVDVAHAAYYPNIDLTGYLGVQSIDIKSLLTKDSMVGQIGPALNLPIFDGGLIEGGYRAARAQYDEAVASYDKTLVHALQDVADAASDSRELGQELVHARAALAESENARRIAMLRYQGGLSRYLEVLTAEDTLVAVRRRVADLQASAFFQDVALIRALGGGYRDEAHFQASQPARSAPWPP